MNNRRNGIMLSYINTLLNMLCGLFLSSFLLRMLGDTEYGIYKTISAFATYLVLFEFGTGTVITRNLSLCFAREASEEEIQRNISTIWGITNFFAIFILIVATVFYINIGNIYANSMTTEQIEYSKRIFIYVVIFLDLSFYIQTLNGINLAFENYTFSVAVSIVKIISRTVMLVLFITIKKSAIIIAMVDMTIGIAVFIFTYCYCKRKYGVKFSLRYFDKNILRESMPLCIAIFLQTIVNQANSNVDNFLIGVMLNPESVAVYSVGLYIYSIFSSMTTVPISMYAPKIVQSIGFNIAMGELVNLITQPCRVIVLIGGAIMFGFFAVGKSFIEIIYGSQYINAWIVAVVVMIPMYINMSNGILVNVLDALNKRIIRSIALMISTILNILLTIYWLPKYGYVGAAVATCICTLLGQVLIMNIYYKKKLGINVIYLFKRSFSGILVPYIVAGIVAFIINTLIKNKYIAFFAGGITFVCIFAGLFLINKNNDTEKKMLKSLFKRIKNIV